MKPKYICKRRINGDPCRCIVPSPNIRCKRCRGKDFIKVSDNYSLKLLEEADKEKRDKHIDNLVLLDGIEK